MRRSLVLVVALVLAAPAGARDPSVWDAFPPPRPEQVRQCSGEGQRVFHGGCWKRWFRPDRGSCEKSGVGVWHAGACWGPVMKVSL